MRDGALADSEHLRRLVESLRTGLPKKDWPAIPRGWRGEAEAALIDAVFSARASYGNSETTGVRSLVGRWRSARSDKGVTTLDDLHELTTWDPDNLVEVFQNRQRVPAPNGMTKAAAIVEAAKALEAAGHPDTASLVADGLHGPASYAYRSVRGLGNVTWTYMMMLLGVPGVKADRMVCSYVNAAVEANATLGPDECAALVMAAARELGADPIHLDHAIWAHQRTRRASAEGTAR